jgi:predicted phosphodiesterase
LPAAAVTLVRGPYLQLLTPQSVTIVWTTDTATACSLAIAPVGGSTTVLAGGTGTVCAIPVVNLSPGASYAYVPLADGVALRSEVVFQADDPDRPSFTFLVLGDSGGGGPPQYAVRDRMLQSPADFMLHTGDMVYPYGTAALYTANFFVPYRDLVCRLVFWPCMGNHDDQIDAGAAWQDTFYVPANNPAGSEHYYSFDVGNAHVTVWDSDLPFGPGSAQNTFIDQDLGASTATWKFVVFHKTMYSSRSARINIRQAMVPIFDRHHVDIVFMGHDHDYERTKPLLADQVVAPGAGTVYVTTGGGGKSIQTIGTSSFTAYSESAFHFVRVTVAGDALLLEMIRDDGAVRDAMALTKGPPRCGDGVMNQPEEQCDGVSDAACPGACRADCTCGVVLPTTTTTTTTTVPPSTTSTTLPAGVCFGAAAAPPVLGEDVPGRKRVTAFALSSAQTVSALHAYVQGATAGAQPIRAVLYANGAGAPGALLAVSAEVTVLRNQGGGFVTFPLASGVPLAAGTYWLGLWSGGTVTSFYGTQTGGSRLVRNEPYSATGSPSNPFGAGSPSAGAMVIYAECGATSTTSSTTSTTSTSTSTTTSSTTVTDSSTTTTMDSSTTLTTNASTTTTTTTTSTSAPSTTSTSSTTTTSLLLFGNSTIGIGTGVMTQDRKRVSKATLARSATATRLVVYLANSSGRSQVARGVIFADSAGVPGALVAQTNQVTISSPTSPQWIDFPFAAPVALAPGAYWIGTHSGAASQATIFYTGSTPNLRTLSVVDAYADGASNPFGKISGTSTGPLSEYVVCTTP